MEFELKLCENSLKVRTKRKGFAQPVESFDMPYRENSLYNPAPAIVYEVSKLKHNGIVSFKRFENVNRTIRQSSLSNLLNSFSLSDISLQELIRAYKNAQSESERLAINNKALQLGSQEIFDQFLIKTHQSRKLNARQSRIIREMSEKLGYYTQTRIFSSKKSGVHKMKVAFLTLTSPENCTPAQFLPAFTKFLEYLHRTANCYYVWKKELGETGKHLHAHIVINNFVPYYIISWKWKRLLIGEGVSFAKSDSNEDSNSHTRIELPKSRKQVSHYISKYMSKAYELPGNWGYIAGFSPIIKSLPEVLVEPDFQFLDELREVWKSFKVISHDFVSFCCVDLLSLKERFPNIFETFNQQYIENSNAITLPQKFNYV